MPSLILHHLQLSPFSEKIRLVLGAKRLAWHSVTVPMVVPKPDVVALTGGYRRTPFLQIGADIYCDTPLMCQVIDAMEPRPALYPEPIRGLAEIVAQWADAALFWAAVPFTSQPASAPYLFPGAAPEFVRSLFADRAAMAPNLRRASIADGGAQLHSYLGRLESLLADGRRFLLAAEPCIADFSVAQSIWYMRRSPPIAELLAPFTRLQEWFGRMQAFGHGVSADMTSGESIAVAAAASSRAPTRFDATAGLAEGDAVTVTPSDYAQDPVAGRLVGLAQEEVVLARVDERAGLVHVHFPRIGFHIAKAT